MIHSHPEVDNTMVYVRNICGSFKHHSLATPGWLYTLEPGAYSMPIGPPLGYLEDLGTNAEQPAI